ncbi:hypothetical protein [Oceanicella actignis]|uniref:Uncharacterized protein n=1 Tax=Oceanicella actignis TaxID=1189325 RepID=A0A1M7S841_9RHOB|nr:hypothetical protein [Oceanicella actignis]SET33312.1 hypothetical protein SAMN04488119_103497 [Oceanicella actignis]SHN54555.1 hypothetical protein SAMN05216200_10211 [Oceanicella actignis]
MRGRRPPARPSARPARIASAAAALAALAACAAPGPEAGPAAGGADASAQAPAGPAVIAAAPALREAAADAAPGARLAPAAEDGALIAALCGAAPRPDLALTLRHPTVEELAACAARGAALTSVRLAGRVGAGDAGAGAFLVYDAAHLRPEAREAARRLEASRHLALAARKAYSGG